MQKKCNLDNIEDEKHALMVCPKYEKERESMLKYISMLNKNFHLLNTDDKFVWLLMNEDKQIINSVAKLVNSIMHLP